MVKAVKLNVYDIRTDEEKTIEHVVRKARVIQYTSISKILGGIISRVKEDEALAQTIQTQFFGEFDKEWLDEETGDLIDSVKNEIQRNSIGSIGFALEHIPEELVSLVAALSGLDKRVVEELDEESFLDLIVAITEVNDIDRLVKLGKKFFEDLKGTWLKESNKKEQKANLESVTR